MRPFRFSVTTKTTEPSELIEQARRAEDLGYSTLAVADHLGPQLAPLVALTAAAGATTSLRLLTLVLANDFRHPAVLAKEAATLDRISGGRLELGLGAGWMHDDYEAAGIAFDRPGVRIDRLSEAVCILKGLFTGEPYSFSGEHYLIDGLAGSPAPARTPHPPIMLAGGSRRILELAGREADIVGVNPGLGAGVIDDRVGSTATPEATDRKIEWIRSSAGSRFGDIELHTRVHLAAISDDREQLAAALAPGLGLTPQDALESPHALVGSISECVEALMSWRERWGITYIGISSEAMLDMAPVVARLSEA
jgi:probable F420-dependent oxidoreductase